MSICLTPLHPHCRRSTRWMSGSALSDSVTVLEAEPKRCQHTPLARTSPHFSGSSHTSTAGGAGARGVTAIPPVPHPLPYPALITQYSQVEALERVVSEAAAMVDRRLMEVLRGPRFNFDRHADAVQRYLLLGQGDFVQALMDLVRVRNGVEFASASRMTQITLVYPMLPPHSPGAHKLDQHAHQVACPP